MATRRPAIVETMRDAARIEPPRRPVRVNATIAEALLAAAAASPGAAAPPAPDHRRRPPAKPCATTPPARPDTALCAREGVPERPCRACFSRHVPILFQTFCREGADARRPAAFRPGFGPHRPAAPARHVAVGLHAIRPKASKRLRVPNPARPPRATPRPRPRRICPKLAANARASRGVPQPLPFPPSRPAPICPKAARGRFARQRTPPAHQGPAPICPKPAPGRSPTGSARSPSPDASGRPAQICPKHVGRASARARTDRAAARSRTRAGRRPKSPFGC